MTISWLAVGSASRNPPPGGYARRTLLKSGMLAHGELVVQLPQGEPPGSYLQIEPERFRLRNYWIARGRRPPAIAASLDLRRGRCRERVIVGGRTIHAWNRNIVQSEINAELRAVVN